MRIAWSLPIRGESLSSTRGDVVRARCLIQALRDAGHEVVVVTSDGARFDRLVVGGYRRCVRSWAPRALAFPTRDLGRWVHGFVHGARVARAVRSARADAIVETQVPHVVSGALATRLTGAPLILDDCSPTSEESAFGGGVHVLAGAAQRYQVRSARSVIAVSRALRSRLVEEGVPRSKIRLIPNGIDVESFLRAGPRPDRRARPDGRCTVGFVGSFQPWHRVELLVDAVATLPPALGVNVVLAGEGPSLGSVLRLARDRGLAARFTSIGAVATERIPDVLSGFDVGVLPHSNDYGHPMKLLEYAAAGIPSVAPDLDPVREVVEDEATGLLFPLGDATALGVALARLALDPPSRERLGACARQRALASGAWGDRARGLIDSIESHAVPSPLPWRTGAGPWPEGHPCGVASAEDGDGRD